MNEIPFSKPPATIKGIQYISEVLESGRISGDHKYTVLCHQWLEMKCKANKALLTTSGTHALELAALLINIKPGDEVILPSFTFSSTANAFILRGARLKYIDIRSDTMNMNEKLIEEAITSNTKAIIPVHYAGTACEMDEIIDIANKYNLFIIEDAAQAILSRYKGKYLGTFGDMGVLSFHESKNISCGEGGAIFVNKGDYKNRAEILREKGTNRAEFFRGEVDKYNWRDIGSSYLPSDINAAFLYSQFEMAHGITQNRMKTWGIYFQRLRELEDKGYFKLPIVPEYCEHNAHIFFINVETADTRKKLLRFLMEKGVYASFHYIPLHSTKIGTEHGEFVGKDLNTSALSERIVRLPIYYQMTELEVEYVIESIVDFFKTA